MVVCTLACHARSAGSIPAGVAVRESSNGRTAAFEAVDGGSNPPARSIALSSNGRTADSESAYRGSNPCEAANQEGPWE
jgi:hypothetical protein